MIRIGMNKKSADPINIDYPFYYTKNNVYTPVKSLFIEGSSRSFYSFNTAGRKIIWMETDSDVTDSIPLSLTSPICKVFINKYHVIEEKDSPCSIESEGSIILCNEFYVDGPCQLVYDSSAICRSVYILAYGNVTAVS